MQNSTIIWTGVAALGLAVSPALAEAHLEDAHSDEASSATAEMPAADIVQARRVTYFLTTQAVGMIKAGIDEGGDLRRTRGGAMMLSRWAETLPKMFPEGTDLPSSRALPTVWSDREGFEAAASAYRDAAKNLAETAATGDREASNAAFVAMAGTCHACHEKYREE